MMLSVRKASDFSASVLKECLVSQLRWRTLDHSVNLLGVWSVNICSSVNHVLANLALRLVVETDFCRMEHLLIVHEKQLLFSLLTFQTLMNQKIGHLTVRI